MTETRVTGYDFDASSTTGAPADRPIVVNNPTPENTLTLNSTGTGLDVIGTSGNWQVDKLGDAYLNNATVPTGNSVNFNVGETTKISETAVDELSVSVNSALSLQLYSTGIAVPNNNKIFLDGGGNTYIRESTPDQLEIYAGGVESLRITETAGVSDVYTSNASTFGVGQSTKIYFDGQGPTTDTYMVSPTDDRIDIIVGGVTLLQMVESGVDYLIVGPTSDLIINSGKAFRFDGNSGGDTYMAESTANVISMVAGGVTSLQVKQNQVESFVDFAIQNDGKIYLDGGADTYLTYNGASEEIRFYISAAEVCTINKEATTNTLSMLNGAVETILRSNNSLGKGYIGTITNHDVAILTNNNTRVNIDGPTGHLTVNNDATVVGAMTINGTNGLTINGSNGINFNGNENFRLISANLGTFDGGSGTNAYIVVQVNGTTYRLDARQY